MKAHQNAYKRFYVLKNFKKIIATAVIVLSLGIATVVQAQQYANIGRTTWDTTPIGIGNTRGRARTRLSPTAPNGVTGIRAMATITSTARSSGWAVRGGTSGSNLNPGTQVYSAHVTHTSRTRDLRMRGNFSYSRQGVSTWRANVTPLHRNLNPR